MCIDPVTDVNLKYNPGTNTLSTGNLKCENLEVSGGFDLNYSAVVALAELLGIELKLIKIYQAALAALNFTFSAGDEVTFGQGGSAVGSPTTLSNYTICGSKSVGQLNRLIYLPGTFRITKVISSGINSVIADGALTSITVNGVEYDKCADPDFGTPCICLAIKVS